VIFQQRLADRQDVRDVVEALVIGLIGRQQRSGVDLQAEEIADGGGVFARLSRCTGTRPGFGRRAAARVGASPACAAC